jgi:hypothetical protein
MPAQETNNDKADVNQPLTQSGPQDVRSQPWKKTLEQIADQPEGSKDHDLFTSQQGFPSQSLAA